MRAHQEARGNDNYYPEGRDSYTPSFKLGRRKSALANLPQTPRVFPLAPGFGVCWRKVFSRSLNSKLMRQPSPPGLDCFSRRRSNLPWVVAELRHTRSALARGWSTCARLWRISKMWTPLSARRQTPLSRHLFHDSAKVPSWLASDGTLRLLTLTIPAYLPDIEGTFLIEEPENGIHPRAIETVLQSLSSIYRGQVLLATHSPVALNMLEPRDVLCFAKDTNGATDIISGDRHPALREWKKGKPDLGVLFASGILS